MSLTTLLEELGYLQAALQVRSLLWTDIWQNIQGHCKTINDFNVFWD